MAQITSLPIFILAGPTASGKSALALDIAQMHPTVIINCDSKQIYQEIPIITAQPSCLEQAQVPHRLYGTLPASNACSVAQWVELAKQQIADVHASGKVPLLVGGTGMYIQALSQGFSPVPDIDPEIRASVRLQLTEIGNEAFHMLLVKCDPIMGAKLPPGDSQRMVRAMEVIQQTGKSLHEWQLLPNRKIYSANQVKIFFFSLDRQKTYDNCKLRFQTMLKMGVVEEIKALSKLQLDPALPAMKAHGVPEFLAYLKGEMTLEEATSQSILNTRHYIKRQWTWYRHQMPQAVRLEAENYNVSKDCVLERMRTC